MLKLSGVTRRYGDAVALDGLDFIVPDDTYVSLLGASGSGKTTLLRLIAGFEEPDAGELMLGGERLDGKPPHRRDIGFVFQNFALFPHLTVEENVAFGLRHRESRAVPAGSDLNDRVNAALDLVGLTGFGHRGVGEISGGQKQRIALARAFYGNPRFLVLDEPNSNLDTAGDRALANAIRHAGQHGITVVVITQKPSLLSVVDKIMLLADGNVALFGHRQQVLEQLAQRSNPGRGGHISGQQQQGGPSNV